jgi:exoribonuclease R
MTKIRLRVPPEASGDLRAGFAQIRAELEIPQEFPADVLAAADEASRAWSRDGRADLREIEFVTIDPPGSRDLDQAMAIAPNGNGFVLRYAIADVSAFVPRAGVIETEAWRRGQTLYAPDERIPLYPPTLSEGAASLLADDDRPAVVFTIDVAHDGEVGSAAVERAVVRSRRIMAYDEATGEQMPQLKALGQALAAASARRGATSIDLPGQEVVPSDTPPGFGLQLETRLPQEDWNAEVSLCANVVAARMMLAAGVGVFRVMGPPDPERVAGLAAAAKALGLDISDPHPAPAATAFPAAAGAVLASAKRAAGAGYVALPGTEVAPWHAAVAAPYAHATAPLRRLADRYVLDLLCDLAAGRPPVPEQVTTLGRLPEVMNTTDARADRLDGACIDLVEAALLAPRVDETFAAIVTGLSGKGVRIQLREPAVRATLPGVGAIAAGTEISVRLVSTDPARRSVVFAPA